MMKVNSSNLSEWQKILNNWGPRLTATQKHCEFINFLKTEITNMGFPITEYPFEIDRCQHKKVLIQENNGNIIPNMGAVPYSGITSKEGVNGELRWYKRKNDFKMRGKIALIKVVNHHIPSKFLLSEVSEYPIKGKPSFYINHPLVPATLVINKIIATKESGAIGVILIWNKISEKLANKEILPFTNEYLDIPAIWIHEKQLKKVTNIKLKQEKVCLTVTGKCDKSKPTESFTVTIGGINSNKSIFINSHTDGPNAIEENGTIALLAILDTIQRNHLHFNHTVTFGFVSGHFQIGQSGIDNRQATSRLLQNISESACKSQKILGLTIEHLGAKEYLDNYKLNTLNREKDYEPMYIYTSNLVNKQIVTACLASERPVGRYTLLKPRKLFYFGEGQPLYQDGWPTISFISMPLALCQLPSQATEPDINLMIAQTNLFFNILISADKRL